MKIIHLPVQIQPIWLSGNQHDFLVSDLTAIRRLNIIIAHAQWILKASLAPHFALLLSERNNTKFEILVYYQCIKPSTRAQPEFICLRELNGIFCIQFVFETLRKFYDTNILGVYLRPLFQNIWDITEVLQHQYFRGLLTFPISK